MHGSEETSPQDAATALDYLHELCRSLAADFPEAKPAREPGIFAIAGNGQSAATSSFAGAAGFRIGKLHNRLRSSIATSYQSQVSPKLLAVFFGAFLMLIFFFTITGRVLGLKPSGSGIPPSLTATSTKVRCKTANLPAQARLSAPMVRYAKAALSQARLQAVSPAP